MIQSENKLERHFAFIKKSKFDSLAKQWKEEEPWKIRSQEIAMRILDWLEENEINQTEFAQLIGDEKTAINWLTGTENFTLENIAKLEEAMGRKLVIII